MICVENVKFEGNIFLAPMDGFSTSPFRRIARKLGAAAVFSEFINAIDLLNDEPRALEKILFAQDERPIGIQIFDHQPTRLAQAAQIVETYNPDFIDINIGCSNHRVTSRGAGAGLLQNPHQIKWIFTLLKRQIKIPITAKIRLGWDSRAKNYMDISKILEDFGCSMITVHGRTQSQNFITKADWLPIKEIKNRVSIPVIANGDIKTPKDICEVKELTGCDGVMIGRGAIENPWIFQLRERSQVSDLEMLEIIKEHLNNNIYHFGETRSLLLFRKYLKLYLKPNCLERKDWEHLFSCKTAINLLTNLYTIINPKESLP